MSTFKVNPPKIKLIAYTPDPLSVIYEVWQRAKDGPILPKDQYGGWDGQDDRRVAEVATFRKLIFDYTQVPEMVQFTWWLEGVPRAFFDQVVRHRKTSIFARSQRVRKQTGFADKGEYLTTGPIMEREEDDVEGTKGIKQIIYDQAMRSAQNAYEDLLELGVPVEDARGILPLHLRTGFAWATTLRDLAETFRTRTCNLLQQEYWGPVMQAIRAELVAIDPELEIIFHPPCQRGMGCVSTHDAQIRADATISGRHDLHPCQIWADQFADQTVGKQLYHIIDAGGSRWAKGPSDV
jgi:thymidylate synthase (FAD)